jgi:type I restriction enzyme, S subunit
VLKVKLHKIISRYLALALNSPRCYEQAQLFTRGATNQDLGLGRMKAIVFALPLLREQDEILKAVDQTTREVQQAIYHAGQEIELLREYRARLIADVVTGKLDVRDAAARLPDVSAEQERPEDDVASTEFEMRRDGGSERETAEAYE